MLIRTLVFNEFFRIGNRQLVAACRFGLWFWIDSESAKGAKNRLCKGRVGMGRVGLGRGRIGVSNADSDLGFQ